MTRIVLASSLAAALLGTLLGGGCSKTVAVDLALIEPCDQTNRALNGASSFSVSTLGSQIDGTATDEIITFTKEQGPQPIGVTLGDVTVTVKAFADDITVGGGAGAIPQAVGRSMPLPISEASGDRSALVTVGLLNTFGKTTKADGQCTSMTEGAPIPGRHGHTATFIPVLNQVLIFGGAIMNPDGTESFLRTSELWDPTTGEYEQLPDETNARSYHAATALPDGRVFISGGFGVVSNNIVTLAGALIFDPVTKEFATVQMKQARAHHTSTLMEGASLIALVGGCFGTGSGDLCLPTQAGDGNRGISTDLLVSIETFDIVGGVATDAVPIDLGLEVGRAFHTATSLENGPQTLLVVAGGANSEGPVCGVELFRAQGGALARVAGGGIQVNFPATKCPVRHAAVSIVGTDNQPKAVIIGGQTVATGGTPTGPGQVDIFEFTTTVGVTAISPLQNGRAGHVAARLQDNSILIIGGSTGAGPVAEIMKPEPSTGIFTSQVLAGGPGQPREKAALAVLPTNQVLFTGGHTLVAPFVTVATAELFFGP